MEHFLALDRQIVADRQRRVADEIARQRRRRERRTRHVTPEPPTAA